jgi:mono/diheme cytochrome c family protein/uncharacterized membrane protein
MIESILRFLYGSLEALGYAEPVHPAVTHLPIGLIFGAFLFGALSLALRRQPMRDAARYCAVAAFVFLFINAAFGYLDWQHFFAGGWLQAIKIKLVLAGLLVILLAAALLTDRKTSYAGPRAVLLYALSLMAVIGLGYFGGTLVYEGRSVPAPRQFRAGERVFYGNCSGCHPYFGNIADHGAPLWGAPQLKDFSAFLDWIRNPRLDSGRPGIMPPFSASRVSNDQAKLLYDYAAYTAARVVQTAQSEPGGTMAKTVPVRTDVRSINDGHTLFDINCSDCHTVDSLKTIVGPGLKGLLKRPSLPVSGRPATPENVYRQLREPYKNMPSFAQKLTDDDVFNLIAFLNTR